MNLICGKIMCFVNIIVFIGIISNLVYVNSGSNLVNMNGKYVIVMVIILMIVVVVVCDLFLKMVCVVSLVW